MFSEGKWNILLNTLLCLCYSISFNWHRLVAREGLWYVPCTQDNWDIELLSHLYKVTQLAIDKPVTFKTTGIAHILNWKHRIWRELPLHTQIGSVGYGSPTEILKYLWLWTICFQHLASNSLKEIVEEIIFSRNKFAAKLQLVRNSEILYVLKTYLKIQSTNSTWILFLAPKVLAKWRKEDKSFCNT